MISSSDVLSVIVLSKRGCAEDVIAVRVYMSMLPPLIQTALEAYFKNTATRLCEPNGSLSVSVANDLTTICSDLYDHVLYKSSETDVITEASEVSVAADSAVEMFQAAWSDMFFGPEPLIYNHEIKGACPPVTTTLRIEAPALG